MNSIIEVKGNDVVVSTGKLTRTLVTFLTPKQASFAMAWCHKHELCVVDAALALLHHCDVKGVPTFGRAFGKGWGSLTGLKPRKVA